MFHLHHDDIRSFEREERLPFRQVLNWIASACRRLHQAIVSAKLRRLRTELMFRHDYDELLPPERDLGKFPQRPVVLGDKWDF